jgi:hypothetical protein
MVWSLSLYEGAGGFPQRVFPERSWIESPVALRQRLDRYKPTLITNGNLYKIAHSEPTVDGPAFATLRDRHADAQGRELQWDEQLASPCSAIQVEAIFCAGRFDKLIQPPHIPSGMVLNRQ